MIKILNSSLFSTVKADAEIKIISIEDITTLIKAFFVLNNDVIIIIPIMLSEIARII